MIIFLTYRIFRRIACYFDPVGGTRFMCSACLAGVIRGIELSVDTSLAFRRSWCWCRCPIQTIIACVLHARSSLSHLFAFISKQPCIQTHTRKFGVAAPGFTTVNVVRKRAIRFARDTVSTQPTPDSFLITNITWGSALAHVVVSAIVACFTFCRSGSASGHGGHEFLARNALGDCGGGCHETTRKKVCIVNEMAGLVT